MSKKVLCKDISGENFFSSQEQLCVVRLIAEERTHNAEGFLDEIKRKNGGVCAFQSRVWEPVCEWE